MDLKTYATRWFENCYNFMPKQFYSQIHLTRACEYKCAHCYFTEIPSQFETRLSFPVVLKILNETKENGMKMGLLPKVDFTGGDPLLHPNFFDIAEYASSLSIPFGIKGNPDLLVQRDVRKKLKKLNVGSISLSLDGLENIHDSIRGIGSFNKVVDAIGVLKDDGFVVKVHTTVSKINFNQLLPLLNFFIDNHFVIDNWTWSRFWTIIDTQDMINRFEVISIFDDLIQAYSFLLQQVNFYITNSKGEQVPRVFLGFKEHLWYPYLCQKGFISDEVMKKINEHPNSVNCTATKHVYIIDSDGEVYKCRKILDSRIGNINSDSLSKMIRCKTAEEFIQLKNNSTCGRCSFFNGCGGCAAIALAKRNSVWAGDPDCFLDINVV